VDVTFTKDSLRVVLADTRQVSAPLKWFARLLDATPEQRARWRLDGEGKVIRWESLDEEIVVERLLAAGYTIRGVTPESLAYQKKLKERLLKIPTFGAVAAMVVAVFLGPRSILFFVLLGLSGGISCYLIVKWRLGHLSSTVLFGGGAIASSLLGFACGWAAPYAFTMFFAWLLYLVIGTIIGLWAESSRTDV
jgi:hypothetical protein